MILNPVVQGGGGIETVSLTITQGASTFRCTILGDDGSPQYIDKTELDPVSNPVLEKIIKNTLIYFVTTATTAVSGLTSVANNVYLITDNAEIKVATGGGSN